MKIQQIVKKCIQNQIVGVQWRWFCHNLRRKNYFFSWQWVNSLWNTQNFQTKYIRKFWLIKIFKYVKLAPLGLQCLRPMYQNNGRTAMKTGILTGIRWSKYPLRDGVGCFGGRIKFAKSVAQFTKKVWRTLGDSSASVESINSAEILEIRRNS